MKSWRDIVAANADSTLPERGWDKLKRERPEIVAEAFEAARRGEGEIPCECPHHQPHSKPHNQKLS